MNTKSRRILAVSAVTLFAGLLVSPAYAEDTATAVMTATLQTTGIIHVENTVVNDNLGTKVAADFQFTIKHFGTNVAGSPFSVTDAAGISFTLPPGTYVVEALPVDGYLGNWTGTAVENGFVSLAAGQEITFTRDTYDVGIAAKVYPSTSPTTDPTTENGGVLPVTSSNWFNFLALGLLVSAAGALGFRKNSLTK